MVKNPRTWDDLLRWVLTQKVDVVRETAASVKGPCHEWTRFKDKDGYGRVCYGKRGEKKAYRIPRLAWESVYGSPGDKCVLHKCDNPSCINPDHLFLGTPKENIADMIRKGRANKIGGERHWNAKLTSDAVEEIRNATGRQQSIADKFGISRAQVYRIKRGLRWKCVV